MVGIKLNKKLPASTVLEVVISMVVILVAFGIAMMIFTKITGSTTSVKELSAHSLLEDQLIKEELDMRFTEQTINTAGFRIEQTVKPYNNITNLLLVRLSAFDPNQQQVAFIQKLEINEK